MVEDAEKHVDLVQQLEKDVKSLKKKLDKLSKQVNEQVAISGFQEQLGSFDKQIKKLEATSLDTQRFVALLSVESLRLFIWQWVRTEYPQNSKEVNSFLKIKAIEAKKDIEHLSTPISISKEFTYACQVYLKAQEIPFFRE